MFYVEHTRHLFPERGEAETPEEEHLLRAMIPVVYWLVLFSIVWHGLSIPALDLFYRVRGVQPIYEADPYEERRLSVSDPLPNNSFIHPSRGSVVRHNRFSRSMHRPSVPELFNTQTSEPRSQSKGSEAFASPVNSRNAEVFSPVSSRRRTLSRGGDVFELRRNAGLEAKGYNKLSFEEGEGATSSRPVEDV